MVAPRRPRHHHPLPSPNPFLPATYRLLLFKRGLRSFSPKPPRRPDLSCRPGGEKTFFFSEELWANHCALAPRLHTHDKMSILSSARGAVRTTWAARVAVRGLIIPDSHQVAEKKAADRVDFWGEPQAVDSRWGRELGREFMGTHGGGSCCCCCCCCGLSSCDSFVKCAHRAYGSARGGGSERRGGSVLPPLAQKENPHHPPSFFFANSIPQKALLEVCAALCLTRCVCCPRAPLYPQVRDAGQGDEEGARGGLPVGPLYKLIPAVPIAFE